MGTSAANWHLQKTKRKGGFYYQAVLRSEGERRAVTLGYLDDDQVEEIRVALLDAGPVLAGLSNDQLKSWALEPNARAQLLDVGLSPSELAKMTVREFVDVEYRAWRKEQVAEGTWEREEPRLNRVVEALGHVRLKNLSTYRWSKYLGVRRVSQRTKKLEQNAYLELLKRAKHLGGISSIHALEGLSKSTERSWPIEPLKPDEVMKLLDAAPTKMHRAMFALGVGIGLRPQEVSRVRWEDVDWKKGQLLVRGSKTEEALATIPLTYFAMDELDSWWEMRGKPTEGLVFTWGGKPIASFKKALLTAGQKAGIDSSGSRRIFPNLLRHSFASMAAASGVPIVVAQQILRHGSTKMLLKVYAKAGATQLREGLEKFPLG